MGQHVLEYGIVARLRCKRAQEPAGVNCTNGPLPDCSDRAISRRHRRAVRLEDVVQVFVTPEPRQQTGTSAA